MIYTNFNFNGFNNKENANKFIVFGILLLILGLSSIFFKSLGITIISYSISAILLFFAYLNLKNINELRRYQTKSEVRPYLNLQWFLCLSALILILFPRKSQSLFSSFLGAYLLLSTLINFIKYRNSYGYRFGASKVFLTIFGAILVISPLFLSSFIVSILSFIIILIGISLISSGNKMKRYY